MVLIVRVRFDYTSNMTEAFSDAVLMRVYLCTIETLLLMLTSSCRMCICIVHVYLALLI
jgi:hypothetical protein